MESWISISYAGNYQLAIDSFGYVDVGYPFHMQAITNSDAGFYIRKSVGYPFHMQAITNL